MDWNVWHWLRLPSLGDIRNVYSQIDKYTHEMEWKLKCLDVKIDAVSQEIDATKSRILEPLWNVSNLLMTIQNVINAIRKDVLEQLQSNESVASGQHKVIEAKIYDMKKLVANVIERSNKSVKETVINVGSETGAKIDDAKVALTKALKGGIGDILNGHQKFVSEISSLQTKSCDDMEKFISICKKEQRRIDQMVLEYEERIGQLMSKLAEQAELNSKQIDAVLGELEGVQAGIRLYVINRLVDKLSDTAKLSKGKS